MSYINTGKKYKVPRVSKKEIVVDGRGHLLGRLASIVAKNLLNGVHVTVVRCEEINQTGVHIRNKFKFIQFLRKKTNTNPKRGPIHERAPSRWFARVVRGMLPEKNRRSTEAQGRLRTFEGIPPPYDKVKRMVVPEALRAMRLHSSRRFSNLGKLASQLGWKHGELIGRLENTRKQASAEAYAAKKVQNKARQEAAQSDEVKAINAELATYGY